MSVAGVIGLLGKVAGWLRLGERVAGLAERIFEGSKPGAEPEHPVPLSYADVAEQQRQQRSAARAFPPATEPLPRRTPMPPSLSEALMPTLPVPTPPPGPPKPPTRR